MMSEFLQCESHKLNEPFVTTMDEDISADKYVPTNETASVFQTCLDNTSENDKYEGPFTYRRPSDDNDSSTLTDEEFGYDEQITTDEFSSESFNDVNENTSAETEKVVFRYPVLLRQRKGHVESKIRQYIKKQIRAEMMHIVKTKKEKYQNMGRRDRINKFIKSNEQSIGNKQIGNWSHDKQLTCSIPEKVFFSRNETKTIRLNKQLSHVYQTGKPLRQSWGGMEKIPTDQYLSAKVHFSYQKIKKFNLSTPAKQDLASSLRRMTKEPTVEHVMHEIRIASELKKMNKQSIHIILKGCRPFLDMMSNKQIDMRTEVAQWIDFLPGVARQLYFQTGVFRHVDFQSGVVRQMDFQTGIASRMRFQTGVANQMHLQAGVACLIDFQTGSVRQLNFQTRVEQKDFQTGVVRQMYFQSEETRKMGFKTGVVTQMHFQKGVISQTHLKTGIDRQMYFQTAVVRRIDLQTVVVRQIDFQLGVVGQKDFKTGVARQMYFQSGVAKQMHSQAGEVSLIDFQTRAVRQFNFQTIVEQMDCQTGVVMQMHFQLDVTIQVEFKTGVVKQMHFQTGVFSQINFQTGVARQIYFQTGVARHIDLLTGVVRQMDIRTEVVKQMHFQARVVSLINYQTKPEIVRQTDFQTEVGNQIEMNFQTGTAREMHFQTRVDRKIYFKTGYTYFQTGIIRLMNFQAEVARQIDFEASAALQICFQTAFVEQTNLQREVFKKLHFQREVFRQTDCDIHRQHRSSRHTSSSLKLQSKTTREKQKHKSVAPTKDKVRKLQKHKISKKREHNFAHFNRHAFCEDISGGGTNNCAKIIHKGKCGLSLFPLKLVRNDIAEKRSKSDESANKITRNDKGRQLDHVKCNSSTVNAQSTAIVSPTNTINEPFIISEQSERHSLYRTDNQNQLINAGITDHPIRYVSCNSETDTRATNFRGNGDHFSTTRVVSIHDNKIPVQQCTRAVNTTSDPNGVITYINDKDTWAFCTSVTIYKPSPNDNKIPYPLPHTLRMPPEGATEGSTVMRNTCCIDGFLVAVFIELQFNFKLRERFKTSGNGIDKLCYSIWNYFHIGEFSKGKIAWCRFVNMIANNCREVDLEGAERERVFPAFNKNVLSVQSKCTNNECSLRDESLEKHSVLAAFGSSTESLEEEIKTRFQSYIEKEFGCCENIINGKTCQGNRIRKIIDPPNILAVNLHHLRRSERHFSSNDVPDIIQCCGCIYDLTLVRFYINGHFMEKLKVLDDWTHYDNKDPRLYYFDRDPDFAQLSSCVYFKRCTY